MKKSIEIPVCDVTTLRDAAEEHEETLEAEVDAYIDHISELGVPHRVSVVDVEVDEDSDQVLALLEYFEEEDLVAWMLDVEPELEEETIRGIVADAATA